MKNLIKIGIILFLIFGIYIGANASVNLSGVGGEIQNVSINGIQGTGNIVSDIEDTGFKLLTTAKTIISGLLLIFIVYIGISMVYSMGSDEEALSSSKRQLRYSLIGFIFINIPGGLYNAFKNDNYGSIDGRVSYSSWIKTPGSNDSNILINTFNFGETLNGDIIGFIEVGLFAIAIFTLILAGIEIIGSKGEEESITKGKAKIGYTIIGLMFLGFIEAWKEFAFNGKIEDGVKIIDTLANLALFFAGPIAILFLTMAGYYFITSNGDEEKVKKAKSIIVNVLLATLILLASYTFLLDLAIL